jgi:multiple sugar transport system substrate-binding protein/raffinose/stachyose/melibiose transport system substrate-binding protein
MTIFPRAVALTASIAALTLALAGCSTGGTSAGSSDKVELRMLVNITPNLTQTWWDELVKPFESANPDIDVKIQAPVTENVLTTVPQLLASGDVPDIIQSLPPTATLQPELLDLSSYDFVKNAPLAEQYKIDGKYYTAGVGQQLQTIVFYNKTAFKEAGITEVPTTLEEFETDLGKLKTAGWTPIQTGTEWFTQLTPQYLGVPTVLSENPDWYAGMKSGDLSWSKTYGKTMDTYADWVKKGYVPADAAGTKYADAEQQFLSGKSAMYPMGSWFAASEFKAANKPEIGVFAAPAAKGTKDPKVGSNLASPYLVMKSTKHADASMKLVEYLTTNKDAVLTQLKVDSNFRDGFEFKTDALRDELQAILTATPQKNFVPTGDGYGALTAPKGYQVEFNTQVQSVLIGGSADTAKKAMDDWWASHR